MKKILAFITPFILTCFTMTVFAADLAAKEETTPPAAEGPLTVDQIAPINSLPMANKTLPTTPSAPATPSSEPGTTNQTLQP